MRTSTDIKVTANVNISRALYNDPKRRETARNAAIVMQRALDTLRTQLDLPADLTVRVCTFRGPHIGGQYMNHVKTAAVRLRKFRDMINSLAHELVHAEQYHQGRLEWTGNVYMWNGAPCRNRGTTYNAYRNLPWEAEAFARQTQLAYSVFETMGI